MLPRSNLVSPLPLHAPGGRTQIDYRNMMVYFARGAVEALREDDTTATIRVKEDTLATRFHEGLHWRQFHGTAVGAFLCWIKHAKELHGLDRIGRLSRAEKARLAELRRGGRSLIELDDEDCPDPPIAIGEPPDAMELAKSIFFDLFTVERLFLDASSIRRFSAPAEEILSVSVADAAQAMASYHPDWGAHEHAELQAFFRPDEPVGLLKLRDPGFGAIAARERQVSVIDLLEAQAIANELFFEAMFAERRLFAGEADEALSVFTTRDLDAADFARRATRFLGTHHGFAARLFFGFTGRSHERAGDWIALMVVLDIALNPPLPPLAEPGRKPRWLELYPPLRFVAAMRCLRELRLRDLRPTDFDELRHVLVEGSGLLTCDPGAAAGRAEPVDFAAVLEEDRVGGLYASATYYHFNLYSQQCFAKGIRRDARSVGAPVFPLHWRFSNHDTEAVVREMFGLGTAPLVTTDEDGAVDHTLGSNDRLGTWYCVSTMLYGAIDDLMLGAGARDPLGFPPALTEAPKALELLAEAYGRALGFDPWG